MTEELSPEAITRAFEKADKTQANLRRIAADGSGFTEDDKIMAFSDYRSAAVDLTELLLEYLHGVGSIILGPSPDALMEAVGKESQRRNIVN